MTINRLSISLLVLAVVACCIGCGGGGGGGGSASSALRVAATTPDLTGKNGTPVTIPIKVTGSTTVSSASFQVHFDSGLFVPADGDTIAGKSTTIAGLPTTSVCRYKWIDAQDISVLYASSTGIATGAVMIDIPVKAAADKATNNVTIQNAVLNNTIIR